jgi:hypothetical protein
VTSTFTLGKVVKVAIVRRALGLPALVLAVSVLIVICTGKSGWLSVGGAVISALGARYWARRLLRLNPDHADDPLPPAVLMEHQAPSGLVPVNPEFFVEGPKRASDNLYAFVGVWLTIRGGMLGSAAPFLVDTVWHGHH